MAKLATGMLCVMMIPAALAADPATSPAPAEVPKPPCRLLVRATLDMDMDSTGRITVPVSINGTAKRMMVDTGASDTEISAAVVTELNLKPHNSTNGGYLIGYGGRVDKQVVTIDEFGLGMMKGKDFSIFVLSEPFDSAGLLGADFLRGFDVDLDFANARMRLIAPNKCSRKVYWTTADYGEVPFTLDGNHISVDVKLDGQPIWAFLDTGAADTVMSLERATFAYDLDRDKLKRSRHYPFKVLSFGEVDVGNPAIQLATDHESAFMGPYRSDLNMIIGMGVLRRLHLYIDYKEKKIYLTPATQY
jgi:predicted aspartyl protease